MMTETADARGAETIRVDDVGMVFRGDQGDNLALTDVDLTISEGETVALLGPSGCGKSTLLSILGGLLAPTSGTVSFGEDVISSPDPHRAAFVFQEYSLLPWKSARDNVAFGLQIDGRSSEERREVAERLLAMVGLGDRMDARPGQLSGGMQQRVAVARALAMSPRVMLMDEPFGALDEFTRRALGVSISGIFGKERKTTVLVTHSIDEAIYWADRVVVMSASPGRIVEDKRIEIDRPRSTDVFTEPRFAKIRAELFELVAKVTPDLSIA